MHRQQIFDCESKEPVSHYQFEFNTIPNEVNNVDLVRFQFRPVQPTDSFNAFSCRRSVVYSNSFSSIEDKGSTHHGINNGTGATLHDQLLSHEYARAEQGSQCNSSEKNPPSEIKKNRNAEERNNDPGSQNRMHLSPLSRTFSLTHSEEARGKPLLSCMLSKRQCALSYRNLNIVPGIWCRRAQRQRMNERKTS